MDRAKEIALLSECLTLVQEKQTYTTEDETLVPVAEYVDEALFDQEREVLFRRSLNIVAHGSQIASPGDFITRDVVGTPVVVVRQKDGTAKAFLNVCRHRGATVELKERGSCRRFVCPYHAWTYELDGSLATVRHKEGFPTLDIASTSLVELRCAEAAGLIWVCPDPTVTECAFDDDTQALIEELKGLGCENSVVFRSKTRVWNTNWKLITDGGLESYHFRIAHKDTIAGFFPDNVSTYQFVGDHIRTVLPRRSIMKLTEQPESEWKIRDHTHLVYSVFPNTSLLMQEGHYELILATPISVDETRLDIMTVVPDPGSNGFSEKTAQFWEANHVFTMETLDEDFGIAEQIQRGIESGANEFFRFAKFEGALTQWHRLIDEKLGRRS